MQGSLSSKIKQEIEDLEEDPPSYINNIQWEESTSTIKFIVIGPKNTPHEGGWFYMRLVFPSNYPNSPPTCYTDTLIFHSNIELKTGGWYCLNVLKPPFWSLKRLSLNMIFLKIVGGLNSPCPGAGGEASNVLNQRGRAAYDEEVKKYVKLYAGKR
jgi:ubiquitin-conjugating enzyme E2 D